MSSPLLLRVGGVQDNSLIYGPGNRFVIWVQGCTLACKGCWNQQFWPSGGGTVISVDDMMGRIVDTPGIEGITLLGGEPLQQSEAVLQLITGVRDRGLSVFLYSGYEESELDETQLSCVASSDIVVLGRYVEKLRDTSLRWRGSSNQRIRFPTDRYSGLVVEEFREIEVELAPDGRLSVFGYPDDEFMRLVGLQSEGDSQQT